LTDDPVGDRHLKVLSMRLSLTWRHAT
jgi:hypothetical protein